MSDEALLIDSWPAGLARRVGDITSIGDLGEWEKMPMTFDDLCNWLLLENNGRGCKVVTRGGARASYTLYYAPAIFNDGDEIQWHPVNIYLHGFLSVFNLRPLGNWTG